MDHSKFKNLSQIFQINTFTSGVVMRSLIQKFLNQKFSRQHPPSNISTNQVVNKINGSTNIGRKNPPIKKNSNKQMTLSQQMNKKLKQKPILSLNATQSMHFPVKKGQDQANNNQRSIVFMKRRVHSLGEESQILQEPSVVFDAQRNSKQSLLNTRNKIMAAKAFEKISNQDLLSKSQMEKSNLNQTQQQFLSLQPIQLGVKEKIDSNQITQNLLKVGQSILKDANKDISELSQIKQQPQNSQKQQQIRRINHKLRATNYQNFHKNN
ncbi:UNKNOWN [Stylonychia lemnae]|uniref:Uncharacterized protein n=1 Tax=Stylonychia lemnae TaxID=5949 RepID=A0A078B245_STYLE|nr:UNKNOWN [Stylonychia lemnae]|eukprot:CDW88336.1 UNKNOWN [Stylonychia lemnae]